LITEARLRDGTRAQIWELLPSDREAVREGYEHLSEETRYHRFLAAVPHLTPALLDHLVGEVDGIDHIALVLVVLDDEGNGTPAGVGRIIRYQDRPTAADLAVTTLDEWQGRGVASALVAELVRRRPVGVTQIVTTIAADNAPSLALVHQLGRLTTTTVDANRLDVVVDLEPEVSQAGEGGPASAADVAPPEPGPAERDQGNGGGEERRNGRPVQGLDGVAGAAVEDGEVEHPRRRLQEPAQPAQDGLEREDDPADPGPARSPAVGEDDHADQDEDGRQVDEGCEGDLEPLA
jgi:GNAT superfamily N-acetyltransferase